jgi:hypothetical protein
MSYSTWQWTDWYARSGQWVGAEMYGTLTSLAGGFMTAGGSWAWMSGHSHNIHDSLAWVQRLWVTGSTWLELAHVSNPYVVVHMNFVEYVTYAMNDLPGTPSWDLYMLVTGVYTLSCSCIFHGSGWTALSLHSLSYDWMKEPTTWKNVVSQE